MVALSAPQTVTSLASATTAKLPSWLLHLVPIVSTELLAVGESSASRFATLGVDNFFLSGFSIIFGLGRLLFYKKYIT
jgi:hypothetical protein